MPRFEDMLPPVIDVEFYGNYSFFKAPEAKGVKEQLRIMVEELENHYGRKPILYCTLSAYHCYIKDDFEDCDLWIRNVYWKPGMDWKFWQYTDSVQLDGYDGVEPCIDVNVFAGTMEDFDDYE